MYIPKPALEDCLTSEISASGGDVMYDYITGSQIRRVHYFGNTTGSHEFQIYEGCTDSTQLFLVGGGGAGGFGERRTVGSGPPYSLPAPASYVGCLNTATQTAGGGGAGGVLFINPNRELTGSLELVPGKWPIYIGDGGGMTLTTDGTTNINTPGEDTTFRYAFQLANDADIPSGSLSQSRFDYDSINIKGGGGGSGGSITWSTTLAATCGAPSGLPHWQQFQSKGGDGGSGGGAANTFCGDGNLYIGDSGSVEFPFRNQGHVGVWYNSPWISSPSVLSGNGGGGYSGSTSIPQGEQTNGGNPKYESIRGYQQFYGVGGGAQDDENCGTAGVVEPGDARDLFNSVFDSGSSMPYFKGSGGQAHVYDFTSSMTETYQEDYFKGTSGEAIITYALTGSQLTQGKLHYIDGGATGGIFTFVPCGEVRLETLTVPAGKQACICAMDTGQGLYRGGDYNDLWYESVDLQHPTASDYDWKPEKMLDQLPSGSGTVTFTTGSDCKSYVEFEGWEDCGSCKQSAAAGIYIGFDISGSSGRTNPLPYYKYPDTTVHYTSSQDYITSSRYNNHDSESFFETRFGAFSNDFDDDIPYSTYVPSASFSTSYDDQNVDFTTGSECYTKYDCDPFDPSTITATGGIEGTYLSGSGIGNEFFYKYHIFESSGSTNETTQRSFQQLNVSSGFSDEVKVLVIGPGGPGGRGIPDSLGSKPYYYGGGGGGGQVKEATINGICSEYTLNIAPGFAQPNFTSTPDVWQEQVGQTILSASDGSIHITSGIGGRGAQGDNFAEYSTKTGWTERSGSGGGGAGVASGLVSGGVSYQSNDGGWGFFGTGSAGGGGGAGEDGFNGSSTATPTEGEGGDGILSYILGVQKYFGGGGAGYGPRGAADGGLGGGADSGIGNSTGSYYGGGGGAWLEPRETYTTPWGITYTLSGRGGDGAVIINYKWKANTSPVDYITYRGLAQYYDMYDLDSYDGTGSLVYNLWKNDNTASLENITGWRFDTDNLGSGSLLIVSSSVHPYVEADEETTNELTAMTVWEVNNQTYDSGGLIPILTDEQFGTSSIGIYAGNDALYGEAIVIKIGDSIVTTESGSAGGFIPRGGFHISQFSYNQDTNEVLWYVDGVSGSATVNETIDDKSFTLNFNSSSLDIGLGNNSVYNVTAIYTASLDWDEMRHNDNFLYPRY